MIADPKPASSIDFTEKEHRTAQIAKALAHPARIAILKILAKRNSCVCGELVEVMPLAQATVSQHLKELKNAGLIQGTISGPKVCYCLNPQGIAELRQIFDTLLQEIEVPPIDSSCC